MSALPIIDRAAINRSNAQRSTGPRTPEGKHKSCLNALRHGLTGRVVVLPGEDIEVYQAFCQELMADLLAVTVGRATLLITHDFDVLDQVDEIVVLEHGRVAERGRHNVLIRAGGPYQHVRTRGDCRYA